MNQRAAITIGVNRPRKLAPLQSAADGAKRMAAWLQEEGFEVVCLSDDDGKVVTSQDVTAAIERFVTPRVRYSLLLVYFSGHGYWQSQGDRWLLNGAPTQTSEAINLIGAMAAAKYSGIPNVVFISDACRSLPDSRSAEFLDGIRGFPNYDEITAVSKIDCFMATGESRPAYEGVIDGAPQSVLTAALMAAYREPEPLMVRRLTIGQESIEVVPNRMLENYLRDKVDALLARISPGATQSIEANVPSDDSVYIARVHRPAPPVVPPSPAAPVSTAPMADLARPVASAPGFAATAQAPARVGAVRDASAVADALRNYLSTKAFGPGGGADLLVKQDDEAERRLRVRMPDADPDHFEAATGFVLRGVAVKEAVVAAGTHKAEAVLLDAGDGALRAGRVRLQWAPPAAGGPPGGAATSLGVRFEDGRGIVLAVLPGYIGHIYVGRSGVSSVNYVPSSSSRRWPDYGKRRGELDRLRAMVALACDERVFQLRSQREAEALARHIRMTGSLDPSLGLYAAHAFSRSGNDDRVRNVLDDMRGDLHAELFDVRLLASRRWQPPTADAVPVVPFCPMLTRTWNLLEAHGARLPEPLHRARAWLCDSLWTTFDVKAADAVFAWIGKEPTKESAT